jgi:hypothetical protein
MHGWFAVSAGFAILVWIVLPDGLQNLASLRYLVGLQYPDWFAVSTGFAIQYVLVWIALPDGLQYLVGFSYLDGLTKRTAQAPGSNASPLSAIKELLRQKEAITVGHRVTFKNQGSF